MGNVRFRAAYESMHNLLLKECERHGVDATKLIIEHGAAKVKGAA